MYNGIWGRNNNLISVAKIPKNEFNELNHRRYRDLAEANYKHVVRPLEWITGTQYIYVVFEYFRTFNEFMFEGHPIALEEQMFSKLFCIVFTLQKKNIAFQGIKVNFEYLRVDDDNSLRILFYPAVTTNPTFSERYKFRFSTRFELGCVGHVLLRRSLPEDQYGYKYVPCRTTSTELSFIIDKLLGGVWSRQVCEIFAEYINSPTERALLLKRLDRNCYPRGDPKYNEPRWREKDEFTDSLRDVRIFTSASCSPYWRSDSVLRDWESLNIRLDRSGTARRGAEDAHTLLDMLRHTIVHLYRDLASYKLFLEEKFPRKDWTCITFGDFMNIIHQRYPTMFVRIFDKAVRKLPNHGKIFEI
jgi:hypothetical protein